MTGGNYTNILSIFGENLTHQCKLNSNKLFLFILLNVNRSGDSTIVLKTKRMKNQHDIFPNGVFNNRRILHNVIYHEFIWKNNQLIIWTFNSLFYSFYHYFFNSEGHCKEYLFITHSVLFLSQQFDKVYLAFIRFVLCPFRN